MKEDLKLFNWGFGRRYVFPVVYWLIRSHIVCRDYRICPGLHVAERYVRFRNAARGACGHCFFTGLCSSTRH